VAAGAGAAVVEAVPNAIPGILRIKPAVAEPRNEVAGVNAMVAFEAAPLVVDPRVMVGVTDPQ
jgi:hypothetical protein